MADLVSSLECPSLVGRFTCNFSHFPSVWSHLETARIEAYAPSYLLAHAWTPLMTCFLLVDSRPSPLRECGPEIPRCQDGGRD